MDESIRDATVEDISGVQHVAERGWTATYGDFLTEAAIETILNDWYSTAQLEATMTAENTIYLVADDNDIAGYASAAPTEDDEAQLYAIYVDPDRWNNGIGTGLLDSIAERLTTDGVERLCVEVLADNTVGVSFYESRGFERTAERDREVGEQSLVEYVYYRDL